MRAMSETSPPSPDQDDPRLEAARKWLKQQTGAEPPDWQPMAGDASFRRYFRVAIGGCSRILMDAPPELEDSAPFVDVARRLRDVGLHAPEIILADLNQGFLLLEDLGDDLYRDLLSSDTVEALFGETFAALAVMARDVDPTGLPAYGPELFAQELDWFTGFYLEKERRHHWSDGQRKTWNRFCRTLVENALSQPQVFVHKDVHSCNLMRTSGNNPGIIDFQDAVRGPVSYDFVSLVWDRYIPWPRQNIERWMEQFRLLAAPDIPGDRWTRWCDLMGLQRNIKIVGRFALLKHEQKKHGYVEMIPRFYGYLMDVLPLYPEFGDVHELLRDPSCAP